jgi:hypothetical protein
LLRLEEDTAMQSRWSASAVVALVTVTLGAPAVAQNAPPKMPIPFPDAPKQAPDPAPSSATSLTGKIRTVDGHVVTLTDGQQLVFVPGLTEQHGEIKPGATIKASYAESAGRKVATSIRVDPI